MQLFFNLKNTTPTLFVLLSSISLLHGQQDNRIIQTAMPTILLQSDTRGAGMGDIGVASSPNCFSQYWNPAKYIFSSNNSGIGTSYTAYPSGISNDIFLAKATYFRKTGEGRAWATSLNYFNAGDIELTQEDGDSYINTGTITPNELTLDFSYSLQLSRNFSMAILGKWLHSNLEEFSDNKHTTNSVAVGISGFFQSKIYKRRNYDALWMMGFNISNIGPKISYDNNKEFFIPTNLRIGLGYKLLFTPSSSLEFSLEATKLLVPTPPIYGSEDKNNNGNIDTNEYRQIIKGRNPDVHFLTGILQSFSDAPNGISEELQEITWAIGSEFNYEEVFFLRTGYFYENKSKGNRNYISMGTGVKINQLIFDLSHALSISSSASPLQNNLRLSLSYYFL